MDKKKLLDTLQIAEEALSEMGRGWVDPPTLKDCLSCPVELFGMAIRGEINHRSLAVTLDVTFKLMWMDLFAYHAATSNIARPGPDPVEILAGKITYCLQKINDQVQKEVDNHA